MTVNWSSIQTTADAVVTQLSQTKQTLAVAESCTGGGIAYAITEVAGSSNCFNQGWVTYSNQAKAQQLKVAEATLAEYGAVSRPTVIEMANGAANAAASDYAIATSGIAGPGGATEDKPVGLVHFAIKTPDAIYHYQQVFSGDRQAVRMQAIEFSFKKLLEIITIQNNQ